MKGYVVTLPYIVDELDRAVAAYEFEGSFADLLNFFVSDAVKLSRSCEMAVVLVDNLLDVLEITENIRKETRYVYALASSMIQADRLLDFLKKYAESHCLVILSAYDEADYVYVIEFFGTDKFEYISRYRLLVEDLEEMYNNTLIEIVADDAHTTVTYEELLEILDADKIEEVCKNLYDLLKVSSARF